MKMEDTLAHALVDSFTKTLPNGKHQVTPMGITAENLAKKYNFTRKECDAYAVLSQQRWGAAQKAGHFSHEIAPIELKSKKGAEMFAVDDATRPQTTIESLSKLSSVFIKETGVVTAGFTILFIFSLLPLL